jgi:SAM-dependent methyltransferase
VGINLEMARLLIDFRRAGALKGCRRIVELGAQEVSVDRGVLREALLAALGGDPIPQASDLDAPALYSCFGLDYYRAIDLSGEGGALGFDLNESLSDRYGFNETFDMVTNLGTTEHCFNQLGAFRNIHDLCRPGGLMIHAVPSQGWANHGFYSYTPRFFADVAEANGYAIEQLGFTVDVRPEIVPYNLAQYRTNDSRDLMLYVVLRRVGDAPFVVPQDSMFRPTGWLLGNAPAPRGSFLTQPREFFPYIKTNWQHVTGRKSQLGPVAAIRGWLGL